MGRVKRFGMTVSEVERKAILDLAEEAGGLSMSAVVRRIIRNAAREKGIWPQASVQEGSSHKNDKHFNAESTKSL